MLPPRVSDGAGHQHVGRNVAIRPFQFPHDAAKVRIFDAALEQATGLHHLMAGVVNRGGGVVAASDERIFVRVLGHAREIFRDLDAGYVGVDGLVWPANLDWSVGLGVPGVQLRWTTHQHQVNAVDVFLVGVDGALRLKAEDLRQPQPKKAQAAGVQEVPAA
jgi:hypothetical protein